MYAIINNMSVILNNNAVKFVLKNRLIKAVGKTILYLLTTTYSHLVLKFKDNPNITVLP
jgi:hypothetical protein